ncbi:MAG: glucuronate isomerase [Victivallaceae bacterium]|nr:glucuronate isomerase [Victivallaceae bacterium]
MDFDRSYLLCSPAARDIFSSIAALPIIDPHNHADAAAIAADRPPADLWELVGATDHYVWELERKCSVPEEFITGDRPPRDKFRALAAVFPLFAGNPVYDWTVLDLRRHLNTDLPLNGSTCDEIWKLAAKSDLRPSKLLAGVETMCTTDDPADTLESHAAVSGGRIRPTWRPDKYLNVGANGWCEQLERLGKRFNISIDSFSALAEALLLSHRFFASRGCVASDHGLTVVPAAEPDCAAANGVLCKAIAGRHVSPAEAELFAATLLDFCLQLNVETNWTTQLHIGAERNVRKTLFDRLGPDAGGDSGNFAVPLFPALPKLLNRFDSQLKFVLYCLDPAHYSTLSGLARDFGANVRTGAAWWLCDSPAGIRRQLETAADIELLSQHPGMVSDSRKLLSFRSRFELFRRALADLLGELVEKRRIPAGAALDIARRVAYDNPREFYFGGVTTQ